MTALEAPDHTYFFVPGLPAPQGSKTFKGFRGGKPILAESSAQVKPWRAMVTTTAHEQGTPIAGPVEVSLVFYIPRPPSVTAKKRPMPCVKPDLDKLIRSTLDGLTDSGIISDDAMVVSLHAHKFYADDGYRLGCDVQVSAA